MDKPINTINMNDMESMMKKSGSEEEDQEDDEEDEDQNSSISNETNSAICFQKIETIMTNKSLLEKQPTISIEQNQNSTIKMNRQLKLNYICICIFAFLIGTDFAVIIPTLWDRLSIDYESSGAFMGLVLSSYSLSGVICGLIMGNIPLIKYFQNA